MDKTLRTAKQETFCDVCMKDGKIVYPIEIDGDDYGILLKCPVCHREGWVKHEDVITVTVTVV